MQTVLTWNGVWVGLRENVVYGISVIPFGLAFGAAAAANKMPAMDAVVMSALVYAGSAQFAVLSLWSHPLPLLAIIGTTFIVNARLIVMGAALQPYMNGLSRWKVYLSALIMTDVSWAYTIQRMALGHRDAGLLVGTALAQWPTWILGTFIGARMGGGQIDGQAWGLDALMAGLFTTTVLGLWRGRGDSLPWLAAAAAALAALIWLPGNWYVLMAGLAAGLTGLFLPEDRPE